MRVTIKNTFDLFLLIAAVSARPALAQSSTASEKPPRAELALGYAYLHSNAPPGGCGCFNLSGGSASFAWAIKPGKWDVAGEVVSGHGSNISVAGYGLTLSAFTAGVRYRPPLHHSSLQPFAQALVGTAHSSGTLVQGSQSATNNAGAAFASNFGGGLDLNTGRRFSIRLVEADYLLTNFNNGANNHQNNLLLGAGVVIHF